MSNKSTPDKPARSIRFNLVMTPDQHAALFAEAQARNVSAGQLIRQALALTYGIRSGAVRRD